SRRHCALRSSRAGLRAGRPQCVFRQTLDLRVAFRGGRPPGRPHRASMSAPTDRRGSGPVYHGQEAPSVRRDRHARAAASPGLAGKKVYVEVPVEVRRKKPAFASRHLFTGEEVTVKGREKSQIDAWCVVTDKDGADWEIMVEDLSKTRPAYSMLATGPLEKF